MKKAVICMLLCLCAVAACLVALPSQAKATPETVVLTGVWFDEAKIGAACYDRQTDRADFVLHPRVPGAYHGTGDLFASILLGGLMQGLSLQDACGCAVRGVAECIRHTVESGRTDTRWGVRFEDCLFFFDERCLFSCKIKGNDVS